jgi:hypothetical protein
MIAAERIERGTEILRRIGWSESEIKEWREEHALSAPVAIDDWQQNAPGPTTPGRSSCRAASSVGAA